MKKIDYLNLIFLFSIIIGDILYMVYDALYFKAITSALFVALGIINLVYIFKLKAKNRLFPILMLVGLIFAFLGDVILEIHFISGAILFAIGHIFFFVSYCFIKRFDWKDLIAGIIIFIPSVLLITLAPIFNFGGILMEIVCVVYALIISLMVGKAVSNLIRERTLLNIIILIGSCLFFFSDLMLLLNVFAGLPVVGYLCLATYYPAEFLLAYSILKSHKGDMKNDKK